ncbi:MAG TPA: hypothetical protein VEL74_12095 [Thermoanaerobaculia bacterium]|nr:hypothetical protein [Thermoanaerobaculia bacterium]
MMAWAEMEHRSGVLPLLAAFFAAPEPFAEVIAGRTRGALGLFTPAPEPGWGAAALAAEPVGGGALLHGEVRLPGAEAGGSIVLVRLPDAEYRLAWVSHDAPGVERRASRTGGPVPASGEGPCWLHLEGVFVGAGLLSRPVTLEPDGELARHLVSYAGVWAATAAHCAREGCRALRRAARTAGFHTSQLVALGITEVEIEADLTAAAVRRAVPVDTGRLAVAAAAARTLSAVAAKAEEMRDVYGLDIDGPLAGAAAKSLIAFLGGPLLLENELARALGIQGAHA